MNLSTKISIQNDEVVIPFLNLLLAEEYILYTKTRTAHRKVNGSNYYELYGFLGNQYNELEGIIDEIAEDIRSLGHFPISSMKDFLSIAQKNDDGDNFSESDEIFETLGTYHESIIRMIQHEIFSISDNLKDIEIADHITGLIERHKEMAWMLRLFRSNPEFNEKKQIRTINKQPVIYGSHAT